MASVTRITQDVRNLLGVKEAEQREASGEQEMASVTRITQDLRDMLGVQEAKAAEAAGKPQRMLHYNGRINAKVSGVQN